MAGQGKAPRVVEFFREQEKNATDSRPILAIRTLLLVLEESTATTMMGLQAELEQATEALLLYADSDDSEPSRSTALSLRSGCELFVRHVTRSFVDFPGDFQACKDMVLRRGGQFAELSERSRLSIARLGHPFVRDGSVLLTHGHSRVVMQVLLEAARVGKQFSVVLTECSPDRVGVVEQARGLIEAGIPVTFVPDAGVAAVMERVDMAIVGAEAVVESGGVVNRTGTFQIGIICAALKKPLYVAVESYKFARLYPLHQRDLPATVLRNGPDDNLSFLPEGVAVSAQKCDYTPAELVTLLFTDLGVLTPAAVSDELIKLYS